MTPFGRLLLTLPRPGEQREDTCSAADDAHLKSGLKVSRSQPIAVVRRHVPAPVPGLMDLPAVERRPFPVPCVGQMEFI